MNFAASRYITTPPPPDAVNNKSPTSRVPRRANVSRLAYSPRDLLRGQGKSDRAIKSAVDSLDAFLLLRALFVLRD